MKNNQKSIRMTDEVMQHVEKFPGKGFNEKFENMVLFCMVNEKDIINRVENLEKRKHELLSDIRELTKVTASMAQIKKHINEAALICKNAPLKGQMKIG